MPRLTETVSSSAKKFNNYLPNTLKYKIFLPPVLKNSISNRGDGKIEKAVCVQEMSVLMACMKKEEYKPHTCIEELKIFNNCMANYQAKFAEMKEAQRKGISVEGSSRLPSSQVNKVLRRYPQKPAEFELCKKSSAGKRIS